LWQASCEKDWIFLREFFDGLESAARRVWQFGKKCQEEEKNELGLKTNFFWQDRVRRRSRRRRRSSSRRRSRRRRTWALKFF
jgi:hypothetical protein